MSLRDLSLRKKLEAEREEMQRQLYESSKLASIGELSAGVAHEINNPLNGIINFAQLLKDEETPRSEFEQQMIDGIIDEGERIAKIVRGPLPAGASGAYRKLQNPASGYSIVGVAAVIASSGGTISLSPADQPMSAR